jgi:hypothetical protein
VKTLLEAVKMIKPDSSKIWPMQLQSLPGSYFDPVFQFRVVGITKIDRSMKVKDIPYIHDGPGTHHEEDIKIIIKCGPDAKIIPVPEPSLFDKSLSGKGGPGFEMRTILCPQKIAEASH